MSLILVVSFITSFTNTLVFYLCLFFSFFPHFTYHYQTQHMLLSFSWPVLTRVPTLGSIWFTRRGFAPNCGALSLRVGCPESDESSATSLLLMTEVGVLCRWRYKTSVALFSLSLKHCVAHSSNTNRWRHSSIINKWPHLNHNQVAPLNLNRSVAFLRCLLKYLKHFHIYDHND